MRQRVVILGAGYAGLLAAIRLDRRARGRAEVVLVNADDVFVERIRLHQRAAGEALRRFAIGALLARTGVRFVRGRVRAIDLARARVYVDGAAEPYDRLLVALGSHVDVDAVPGARDHAYTLDPASALALEAALPRLAARRGRLVVCGGGPSGIEAAAELAERYPALRTTLVTRGRLGARLSARAAEYLRGALARRGVEVIEQAAVRALEDGAVWLDRHVVAADACLWAGGFAAPALLAQAGLAVGAHGRALVDEALRSLSDPEVYVVGDAAALSGAAADGAPLPMGCKTAMPMGAHAADNLARALAGAPPVPFDFGDPGVCISAGRADGVVELRRRDGTPTGRIFTGRLAAYVKERICRYALWSLRAEGRAGWRYRWRRGAARPALPASVARRLAA